MRAALCGLKSEHFFHILIVLAGVHDTLIGILEAGNGKAVKLQNAPILQSACDGRDATAKVAVGGCPGGNGHQRTHQDHRDDHAGDLLLRLEQAPVRLRDNALLDHGFGQPRLHSEGGDGIEHTGRRHKEGEQGQKRLHNKNGKTAFVQWNFLLKNI